MATPLEDKNKEIDYLRKMLEFAKKELVLCEQWELWLKQHPEPVIEGT